MILANDILNCLWADVPDVGEVHELGMSSSQRRQAARYGRWKKGRAAVPHDLVMSATTPAWVPLVIAVTGLTTTIAAAVLTQWHASRREDVRWERERQERHEEWQREDSLRWRQARLAAYARLTAAMYHWDNLLRDARDCRRQDARAELDMTEINRAAWAATEALADVIFLCPVSVGDQARRAVIVRERFTLSCLKPNEVSRADLDQGWNDMPASRKRLRDAMRADVGLERILEKAGSEDADEATECR
jgi:hypothetical protein